MAQAAEEEEEEDEGREHEQSSQHDEEEQPQQEAEHVDSEEAESSSESEPVQQQQVEVSSSEETETEEEPQLKRRRRNPVVEDVVESPIQKSSSSSPQSSEQHSIPVITQTPTPPPAQPSSSVPEEFLALVSGMRKSIHELRTKIENQNTKIESQELRLQEQNERIVSLEAEVARLSAQEEHAQAAEVVEEQNEENDDDEDNNNEPDGNDEDDDDDNDGNDDNEGPSGAILVDDDEEKNADETQEMAEQRDEQITERENECREIVPYQGLNIQINEVGIEKEAEIEKIDEGVRVDESEKIDETDEMNTEDYMISIMDVLNFNVEDEAIENDLDFDEEDEDLNEKESHADEIVFENPSSGLNEYILDSGEILTEQVLVDEEEEENEYDKEQTERTETSKKAEDPNADREERRKATGWFKPQVKRPSQISFYDNDSSTISGLILSWKYEEKLNLLCIKRKNGIQYFNNDRQALSSLPKCELWHLSTINMINRSNNGWASHIEKTLREEANTEYKTFKPAIGKRRIYRKRINKLTGRPLVRLVYPPAKTLMKIPLIKLSLDCLKNFVKWWYHGTNAEAVIERSNEENIYIYDPVTLINLSEADLKILHLNPIIYHRDEKDMAMTYQRVVRICIEKGIHAGSQLPLKWK